MTTYHHAQPTLYFVGPTYSQFLSLETGFIFAEFEAGNGEPRYLFFTSMFEAQVHVDGRNRQLKARGQEMELLLSNHPTRWSPPDRTGVDWGDYPESHSDEDAAFWRAGGSTGKAKPYHARGWGPDGSRRTKEARQ